MFGTLDPILDSQTARIPDFLESASSTLKLGVGGTGGQYSVEGLKSKEGFFDSHQPKLRSRGRNLIGCLGKNLAQMGLA